MEPGRERDEFVLLERRAGKTYKEIAAAIGRSTVQARYLVERAERMEREGYKPRDNFLGLSTRTANTLLCEGISTRKDAIEKLLSGYLKPGKIPNYGAKSHAELCAALEIEAPVQLKAPASPRTINTAIKLLERHGYTVTPNK